MKYKNKREEITDIITPEAFDDPEFKKGIVLKMEKATIRLTRVDRKNKRVWGEHIVMVDSKPVDTHLGHNVDTSEEVIFIHGVPYCTDCSMPVSEEAKKEQDNE